MVLKIVDSLKMFRVISTTLNLMFYLTLTIYYRGDAAPVTNINQAMKYLSRFGYLSPGYQNSSYSSILSIKTIRDFQSFGGLKITGKLDEETLKLMNTPRCEVPDRVRPGSSSRTKRFVLQGSRWPKKQLTYKISKYTTKMNKSDVDREIARAFQMWADVTDLTFVHQNNESDNADIDILFVTGEHGNCPSFNNYLGDDVYAHATYPEHGGDAHFDENQPWTINSNKGVNLFQIATHEFGHSLGLNHSNLPTAVMYPYHTYSSDFKLDKDDIEGIQELYGKKEGENPSRTFAMEFKAEWTEAKKILEAELKETFRRELEKTKTEWEKTRAGLSKTVDNLSEKLNATEKKLINLSTEFKMNIQRVGHEIEVAEENVKKDLRETSNKLETATRNLASTMTEMSSTKSAIADLTKMLNDRTSEIFDIGHMPTSCFDLQRMGHKLSGFFSVKGVKQMEMIYCDFFPNQNEKQKWIGYADVKSAPVHFYVQRNSIFDTKETPIPFDLARVNEGNAMNLTTGKFTAPRPGIYFFTFTGLVDLPASPSVFLGVGLYLNGDRIGRSLVDEANTKTGHNIPLTIQSTLKLKKDDNIWVKIDAMSTGAYLDDSSLHYTHFTGFMLEEDILESI